MKILNLFFALFMILPLSLCIHANQLSYSVEQPQTKNHPLSATEFIKSFYTWYFEVDTGSMLPERHPDIVQYVKPSTLAYILRGYESGLPGTNNAYFTKVNNYNNQLWRDTMFIHPSTNLGEVTIVPVSFGEEEEKINIVLFLEYVDSKWQIIKAADTRPYP